MFLHRTSNSLILYIHCPRIMPLHFVPLVRRDFAHVGRVPSFPSPTSDIFPAAVLADRMERRFLGVGARNEFNSTALRNWLRSHSSGKFLIVCPAPSGEFARSRRGNGHRSLPAAWPPVFMSTGHNRGIPSVPGSFSDPRPAGPLMVMVITGPNCEQWNYEISKFAATVLASTHACSFHYTKAACVRLARKELIYFNDRLEL